MLRRHHGHQRFGAHFLKTLAPVDAGPLKHQRQLGAATVQQRQRIDLRGRQHFHLQQRVFVRQCGQRGRPARGQQLGRNGQGQSFFQPLRQRQCLGVELLQLPGQQPCLGFQRPGGGGGPGLAAAAVKQLHGQLGLQVGDGHAHGRRHARQRSRSGGERAMVQRREEHLHAVGGECHG